MEPYIQPLLQRLVPILHNKGVSRSIPENASITIGRLALVCPNAVAPSLDALMMPLYGIFSIAFERSVALSDSLHGPTTDASTSVESETIKKRNQPFKASAEPLH